MSVDSPYDGISSALFEFIASQVTRESIDSVLRELVNTFYFPDFNAKFGGLLDGNRTASIAYMLDHSSLLEELRFRARGRSEADFRLIALAACNVLLLRILDHDIERLEMSDVLLDVLSHASFFGTKAMIAVLQVLISLYSAPGRTESTDIVVLSTAIAIGGLLLSRRLTLVAIEQFDSYRNQVAAEYDDTITLAWYGPGGIDVDAWRKVVSGCVWGDDGVFLSTLALIRRIG